MKFKYITLIVILTISIVYPLFSQYGTVNYIRQNGGGGGFFRDLTTGDINGDGLIDVISARTNPYRIEVYYNNGDSAFSEPVIVPHGTGRLSCIAIVNADTDPAPDIVYGIEEGVLAYIPNKNGQFGEPVLLDTTIENGFFSKILVKDMNCDGIMDLFILEHFYSSLALGKQGGGFDTLKVLIAEDEFTEYYSLETGYFNNDTLPDFVIGSGGFDIYINKGNAEFAHENNTFDGLVIGLATGDFNGDGYTDISYKTANFLKWRFVDNNVVSTDKDFDPSQAHYTDFLVTDADLDGDNDIVAVYDQVDNVVWFKNDGSGNFSSENVIHNEDDSFLSQIETADLNNDGKLDLVWAGTMGVLAFQFSNSTPTSVHLSNESVFHITALQGCFEISAASEGILLIYNLEGIQFMQNYLYAGTNQISHNLPVGAYIAVFYPDITGKPEIRKVMIVGY